MNRNHGVEPDEELREIDGMDASHEGAADFLQSAFREMTGWADVDTTPAALARQREESARQVRRQAAVFRDCFSTPAGQKCLQLMREMTIGVSPYPIEAQLPLDAITALVIYHDAQCNFVRAIDAAIAQAGPTS